MAGLLALAPLAFSKTRNSKACRTAQRIQQRELALFRRVLAGYALFAAASTLPHGMLGLFGVHVAGMFVLIVLVRIISSDGGVAIARVLPPILGFALLASLIMGFVAPEEALAGGRLRGIFGNANLLGYYAFVTLLVALLLVGRRVPSVALSLLSIYAIILTGSRTSAIAATVAILILLLHGHRLATFLALPTAVVAILTASGLFDLSGVAGYRSVASRDGSIEEALRVWSLDPFLGVGFGGLQAEVASSPLKAFVVGGLIALLGIGLMYASLALEAHRRGPALSAACLAFIVHSFGEAWLLSAVGPMMLVFAASWIGLSTRCPSSHAREPRKRVTATRRIPIAADYQQLEGANY